MRTPAPLYSRLTVLAPGRRVDVALPVDVPLAELVPLVLELLGEPRAPAGPPDPWRFTGSTGGPLPPASTLDELGVLDGEVLRLGPAAPPPPPPVFDDPVQALAELAVPSDRGSGRCPAIVAIAAVSAAAGLLATMRTGTPDGGGAQSWTAPALALLGAVAALAQAARRRNSTSGADGAALVAACCAVPLAAAAGWGALPGPADATHLLLAVVSGGTAAALGQLAVRAVAPPLIGTVVVAVLAGTAVTVGLRAAVAGPAVAAGTAAVAASAGPLLPRVVLRLAGLPRPVVPAGAAALVAADAGPDLLPADELADRARTARDLLTGLSGGCALTAALAAPVAAGAGWAGRALAVVVVGVLLLRARGFADPVPARIHLAAAVGAGIAVTVCAAWAAGPVGRLSGALVLLGAAAVGAVDGTPPLSPVVRRAVDIAEGVLTAAAVPLALAAAGVFALVRAS